MDEQFAIYNLLVWGAFVNYTLQLTEVNTIAANWAKSPDFGELFPNYHLTFLKSQGD